MALTMRAVLRELDRIEAEGNGAEDRVEVVHTVARAALMGARGNSGVILSQIVRGAAEELAARPGELVDPVLVSAAVASAADAAYESVRDPAEGTMLTVLRAMSHAAATHIAHLDAERQRLSESDATAVDAAAEYRQEVRDRRAALESDKKQAVRLVAQRKTSKEQVLALPPHLISRIMAVMAFHILVWGALMMITFAAIHVVILSPRRSRSASTCAR